MNSSKSKLLVLLIYLVSNISIAQYAIAPQSYISDFPNEQIYIQSLGVSIVSRDVVIPGNSGMDIVISRRTSGTNEVILDRIELHTKNVYASDDTVYSLPCLGEIQDLSIYINQRRLVATGYDSSSQIPSAGTAFFDNGSYFKCEGATPTLHFSDGKKYNFIQVREDSTSYGLLRDYYVGKVSDRYGNSISYVYENDVLPASYKAPKLLKTIRRNDGQVVNFIYDQVKGSYSRSSLTEINYSGKKIEYKYLPKTLKYIDAEDRETVYTYAGYTGGSKLATVRTPDGLLVEYLYGAYSENLGLRTMSYSAHDVPVSLPGDNSESGGHLIEKTISGVGVAPKSYSYRFGNATEGGAKTIVVHKNYKSDLDLTTEYTYKYGRSRNWVGQIIKVRGYEGEYTSSGNIRQQYSSHNLLYQLANTWEQINSGTLGCHKITDIPIYDYLDCSRYEISNTELKIKNIDGVDTYTTDIDSFSIYGLPLSITESFGSSVKVTKQSYDHDVSKWILNQPRLTRIGKSDSSLKDVKELTYYNKNHASYPFMPYELKSFGEWQEKYTQYHTSGDLKKVEFNEKLVFGDKSLNRYELRLDYKRGIPQVIKVAGRYSLTPDITTKKVDVNGLVTQTIDFEGNAISYGYDKLGRLKYIDPKDDKWSDTHYTWLNDTDGNVRQVVSRCKLNLTKAACLNSTKMKSTTVFDARLRPIIKIKTDVLNQKSIYQNFEYNHFGKEKFVSFHSESANESLGVTYSYDGLQRQTSESISNGGTKTTSYLSGNRVQINDFRGKTTTTTYRAYGEPDYSQAVKVESPESVSTTLSVNVYGQIEEVTQAGPHKNRTISHTQTNLYDSTQKLCMVKRTDVGNTYYNRNKLGKINWLARGVSGNTCGENKSLPNQKVVINYDNRGDKRTEVFGDGTASVITTLDRNGDLKSLISGGVNHVYEYNSTRLLEKESLNIDEKNFVLDYEYNSLGHLNSLIYPSKKSVSFAPNAFGQPTKAGTYATSAKYHPNGQIFTFTYGNELAYRQTLDDQKRPYNLTVNKGSVSRLSQTYTYDNNNNINHIYDNTNHYYDIDLGYDDLGRLDFASSDAWGAGSFEYDALGNLTNKTLGSQNLIYNYNSKNQLGTVTGKVNYNFQYNSDGSVKHNGRYGLTFNRASQLITANGNSYVYDGNNRLVKKTSSGKATYSFYSLNGTLYHLVPADGNITEYFYLGDKLVAKELAFKATDDNAVHKNKPIAATNLRGSTTSCSNFTGCTLYISWQHNNTNNVTFFELEQRGESNTGGCPKGDVCLDSISPLSPIKIGNEWIRIYNGNSLNYRPTVNATSLDFRVRACNPVGCSPYSAIVPVTVSDSI